MQPITYRPMGYMFYGLNKKRNFLDPPDCDYCTENCDHRGLIIINDFDEWVEGVFNEYEEIDNAAIFAYALTGDMYAVVKQYEDILDVYFSFDDMEFFQEVDEEFDLSYYAIIVEVAPGKWKVVWN